MALDANQIQRAWHSFVEQAFGTGPVNFTKADLKAAVQAVDSWATANATSYNNALPEPFKSQATVNQKAALLALVCNIRWSG